MLNRERLTAAWKLAAGVCPAKTPKPIYQYVKLQCDNDGNFVLHATDGEMYVQVGSCEEPTFSRLLPAKRFCQTLAVMAGDQVAFDGDDITCDGDKWALQSPDVADWSISKLEDLGRQYWIDAADLKAALQVGIICVDESSTRYSLGGCLFQFTDADTLAIVATDSRRLAVTEVKCECSGDADTLADPVIPAKAVRQLIAMLPAEGKIAFRHGTSSGVQFETDDARIYARLIEGKFPQWQSIIPARSSSSMTLVAGGMIGALDAAAVVNTEENIGVTCTLDDAGITASAKGGDVGESTISRGGLFGSELSFQINPDYLTPVLKKLGADRELEIQQDESNGPIVLSHDGGFRYLLMPLE